MEKFIKEVLANRVIKHYRLSPDDGVVIYTTDEVLEPDFNLYNSGLLVVGDKREFMDGVGVSVSSQNC